VREQLFVMDIDRAAGVLVLLRRCTLAEAFDELLDASKRHRVSPLGIARALVALAVGTEHDDQAAAAAARYEWGSVVEPEAVA
jgi:ANTAR domain